MRRNYQRVPLFKKEKNVVWTTKKPVSLTSVLCKTLKQILKAEVISIKYNMSLPKVMLYQTNLLSFFSFPDKRIDPFYIVPHGKYIKLDKMEKALSKCTEKESIKA